MAQIKVQDINWEQIAEEVGDSGRKTTGMVAIIEDACRQIMKNGEEFTIRKLQNVISVGLNKDLDENDEKFDVNWITVKHVMVTKDGFRAVEGKDNTFVLDPTVKRAHGRKIRKLAKGKK